MMNVKKYYSAIFILSSFLIIRGQFNIIPPSPNASSISKFVENEVSLNNGTVNVTIPIYKFTVDGVTVDVNLAYNTRGIMVAEDASDVGLGWTLNAGGIITRQVRGIIDERPKSQNFLDGGYLNENYVADYSSNYSLRADRIHAETGLNPNFDYFPDLFHLTFPGGSTKFIFDNSIKQPVMQSLNDMKLEVVFEGNNHKISSFTLTDEKGNKYYFGSYIDLFYKTHRLHPGPFDPSIERDVNYPTAWYLHRIETASKQNIDFSYSFSNITTYSKEDSKEQNSFAETEVFKTQMKQHFISGVSYPGGSITFNKSTGREDLDGGSRLESIEVKQNNNVIKTVQLNYEYKTGGSVANIHGVLAVNDPSSAKRLFLNAIDFNDRNSAKINSYSFQYNPTLLPSKYSTSIDYWGYYNGFNNGDNLLFKPELRRREVNLANLQAGVLKKITYPTGGYSEFEYEPNYTKVPLYWDDIYITEFKNDENFFNHKFVALVKNAMNFVQYDPNNSNPNAPGYYYSLVPIQIGQNENIVVRAEAGLGLNCTEGVETTSCMTRVSLQKIGGGEYPITHGYQDISLPPGQYKIKVTNTAFTASDAHNFEDNFFSVYLFWDERKTNLPYDFIGGGLRIKSITNFDGSKNVKKNYSYTLTGNSSSGRLIGLPNYFYKVGTFHGGMQIETQKVGTNKPISNFNAGGTVSYLRVTESFTENSTSNGSSIYTFTNFPDLGEYYRSHFPQVLPTDLGYLRGFPLSIQTKDSNGILLREIKTEYKLSNFETPFFCYTDWSGQQKCEHENNSFQILIPSNGAFYNLSPHYVHHKEFFSIPMYIGGLYRTFNMPTNTDPNAYRVSFFTNIFYRKTSTEITDFLNGASTTQKTFFNYDNPDHRQLTSKHDILSDFSETLATYSYAHEKGNQYLIGKNMIGIPLETITTKKKNAGDTGKVISHVKTEYPTSQAEADTKTSGLPLPYEVLSKSLQNTDMTKEVTYTKYDPANGNLQEYKIKDQIPVAIIWGYNSTQPIAKIEGATYADVQSLTVAIINASNTDAAPPLGTTPEQAEIDLQTVLDTFRRTPALANFQITTYTYDPLIGVRSITPPSGIREYYFYDTANRLEFIKTKDEAGNFKILKEFKYNYKQ